MPTALITGANRGLGFEYTRQYTDLGWHVIACTRKPETAQLQELNQERLRICQLDVTNHIAIDKLAEVTADIPLDVLINNAGTTGPKGAPECMEYSSVDNTDYEIWRQVFEVNVLAAFKVATAFHPHLARAERGVLLNMSSDLGSMAQNTMGNMYSYRSSKSALNMLTAGFSNDWKDVISISMAPGWCRTELGGVGAEIDPAESVAEQIKTIAKLTAEQSGCFIDRFAKPVAW
jgi:NAD(P)-dependent dehydrogenase (short-subunit alcohol dehydrogenase family)